MGNMDDFRKWPQAGRAQLQEILLKSKSRYIELLGEKARKLEVQITNEATSLTARSLAARELEKVRQDLRRLSK